MLLLKVWEYKSHNFLRSFNWGNGSVTAPEWRYFQAYEKRFEEKKKRNLMNCYYRDVRKVEEINNWEEKWIQLYPDDLGGEGNSAVP